MKLCVMYESGVVLPEEISALLTKYEGIIAGICGEPDKLDCYMASMRKELIVWFCDHLEAI